MIIRVLLPVKDKWTVSIGKSTGYKRKSATACFNLIERKLSKLSGNLCLKLKDKWVLKVKKDKSYLNESLPSFEAQYLLYCLLCFLEDYLTPDFIKKKEKTLLTKIK